MNYFNFILRRIILFFGSIRLALGTVLTVGITLAIASLFLFARLADDILDGETLVFDTIVRDSVHELSVPWLTTVMQAASFLGSTEFLFAFGTILVIAFFVTKHYRRAITFSVTTLGAALLIALLKLAFRRPRPEPFFETLLPDSFSFPSGHSLGSFCFYGAVAAIIVNRLSNRWLKLLTLIIAAALILLIGVSRVYLGVHYPSDVLAGFIIGFIWVTTIAITDKLLRARDEKIVR